MPKYEAHDTVFPVVSFSQLEPLYMGLWGTAFSIGSNIYMTARHVLESAQSTLDSSFAQHLAIGQPEKTGSDSPEWIFSTFTEYEKHDELDIAIFRVEDEFEHCYTPKWAERGQDLLSNVFALGYPYALDIQSRVINVRGIKGHIIGTGKHLFLGPAFQSYELSFLAPRGLSGAPLLTEEIPPRVCGLLIGNMHCDMEVFSERRVVGDTVEVETIYETMNIGLAVQDKALRVAAFEMIDGTIEKHLSNNHLLSISSAR